MSDLVERLREEPYPYEKRHGLGITAMEVWHKTACEAADEIERLQKRNALLEDVAVAAEKMADFIVDYDGCDGGVWREFWAALDKLRDDSIFYEAGDE